MRIIYYLYENSFSAKRVHAKILFLKTINVPYSTIFCPSIVSKIFWVKVCKKNEAHQ